MTQIWQANGHTGQVQFDGQFVTITRKAFLARARATTGVDDRPAEPPGTPMVGWPAHDRAHPATKLK